MFQLKVGVLRWIITISYLVLYLKSISQKRIGCILYYAYYYEIYYRKMYLYIYS